MKIHYVWDETQTPCTLTDEEIRDCKVMHIEYREGGESVTIFVSLPTGPKTRRVRWTLEADVPLQDQERAKAVYTYLNDNVNVLVHACPEAQSWSVSPSYADLYPEGD